MRLGNAGGAKGPDFWCAVEDGEAEVIGDEPENTVEGRNHPRLLCRGGEGEKPAATMTLRSEERRVGKECRL